MEDKKKYKFCANCGTKLPLDSRFCSNCSEEQLNSKECKFKNDYQKIDVFDENIKFNNIIEELHLVNFERKNKNKSLFAILIGIFIIFSPSIFEIDNMNGGYALSFIGILITLTSLVTTILIFNTRVRVLDSIIAGENIVACWRYSPTEWKKFKKEQYDEAKESNKGMLIFMIILSSLIFIPFIIFSEAGRIMLIVFLVLIGILSLAAFLSTASYKKITKDGFVILTKDGLLMNKELHSWKGLGTSFRSVGYCTEDPSMLSITYNVWYYKKGHDICTVVFPIPKNEKETAARIIAELS